MNYEQKMYALQALAEISVRMRKPGDWYVNQDVSVKDDHVLISSYGNGLTPEEAIDDHWDEIAMKTSASKPIVVIRHTDEGTERKHYFWNGFMWCDCTPKQAA